MLTEYIPEGGVMVADEVLDWREAVSEVTRPLLDVGAIRESYVEAIIASISGPNGTYIDVGGGVAMAHARPESGVVKTSLSVLHVARPFDLADDPEHPITTMFCLAAEDADSHIELMQALAGLLTDPARLEAVNAAADVTALTAALG